MLKKLVATALLTTAFTAHAAPVFNIFELGIQPEQSAAYDEVGKNNITTISGRVLAGNPYGN